MARRKIPSSIQDEILIRSRRRCSLCFGLVRDKETKRGQIAHIDRNNANARIENLVFLCLSCHDLYDTTPSQSKNYTPSEIKAYRDELYASNELEFALDKNVISSFAYDYSPYNGMYTCTQENSHAELRIRCLSGDKYLIDGIALWGINRIHGPNIGELCAVAEFNQGILYYSQEHEKEIYSIKIYLIGNEILVKDENCSVLFGMGVSFAGKYQKCQ